MKRINRFQKLCGRITKHRFTRKYEAKYENRVYCRCRICGKHLWREIKRHQKEDNRWGW